MEFRILGSFEILRDGRAVRLGGPQQRALFVDLLIHSNEVVSLERLVEDLWGKEPPDRAAKTIQVYVSQLRKLLPDDRLLTRRPGYMIKVGSDELDAHRFERLAREGMTLLREGDPVRASAVLHEAVGLWRGQALADFAYEEFAQAEITQLEESRTSALEGLMAAELACGRHAGIVGELRRLVASYPLREALRGQLMLVLYRSGRQAEALDVYEETRRAMVDELGIDPGPELQSLHQAILTQDPALRFESDKQEFVPDLRAERAPEEAVTPPDIRKVVTLVVSTVEAESLDPEVAERLLGSWRDIGGAVIERHGGTVAPSIGDALVAVFGFPTTQEFDALRAVRAADELQQRTAEFARERKVELSIRSAVTRSEVLTGSSLTAESLAVPGGSTLRLVQEGDPGDLLIDNDVHHLVRDVTEVESIHSAFRVLEVSAATPSRSLRFNSPMVGRANELLLLGQASQRAAGERTCHLTTILGAAGVGKSRLVHEFLIKLRSQLVLRGRCLPYGEGITFWPVVEAVRQAAAITDQDEPDRAREKIGALIADTPDAQLIAERVTQAIGLAASSAPPGEVAWGIRKLMESLARERPLILVFEDIHWGEATFLDLVEHIAEWTREAPILLVCTARPELLEFRPGWGGGKVNATSLLLEVLSEDDSNQLIANLLGEADVPDAARSNIVGVAEGNPLFVEEMLSMLVDEGLLVKRDHRWVAVGDLSTVSIPPTIQALIDARLDRLTSEERQVLESASVVGKAFSPSAVSHLLPGPLKNSVSEILKSLVRKDLIRVYESAWEQETFRFRHMLIQEAAYRSLTKVSRVRLHENFADWLELQDIGESNEIIGYHLERACNYRAELGPEDEDHAALALRAGQHLGAAGQRALGRGDPSGAVKLLSRAAQLVHENDTQHIRLQADLADGLIRLGRFNEAESVLLDAIEKAREIGDEATRWRSVLELCDARFFSDPGASYKQVLAEVDEAMKWFESVGDDVGIARGLWTLAGAEYVQGHAGRAEAALMQAIDHARKAGDRREVGRLLISLANAFAYGPCPAAEAIARLKVILEDLEGHRLGQAIALAKLAAFHAMEGNFDEARALFARSRAIRTDLGTTLVGTMVLAEVGSQIERLAGQTAAAEPHLAEGYAELEKIGDKAYLPMLAGYYAHLLYALERWEEADRFAAASEQHAASEDIAVEILWRSVRAKILARIGESNRAIAFAEEAVAIAGRTDYLEMHGDALMDLAEVLVLADRPDAATVAASNALELYERKGNLVLAERARKMASTAAP